MRMWMVDPKLMCNKHLCGEHVEIHMFIGSLKKQISMDGYIQGNLLEPKSLYDRHLEIAKEMIRRELHHRTPLDEGLALEVIQYLPPDQREYVIDRDEASLELFARCSECRREHYLNGEE